MPFKKTCPAGLTRRRRSGRCGPSYASIRRRCKRRGKAYNGKSHRCRIRCKMGKQRRQTNKRRRCIARG